jgi:hypothetical protein
MLRRFIYTSQLLNYLAILFILAEIFHIYVLALLPFSHLLYFYIFILLLPTSAAAIVLSQLAQVPA